MKIAITQPEFMPFLGFVDKMRQVDMLVLLDDVQYNKREFQNRNRIRSKDGFLWMTVPVKSKGKFEQKIMDVEIDNSQDWRDRIFGQIVSCYFQVPFYSVYRKIFKSIFEKEWDWLVDLNVCIIDWAKEIFRYKDLKIIRASELNVGGVKSEHLANICRAVGATEYLSGKMGKDYLEEDKFDCKVSYQDFKHPVYKQMFEPFLPDLSFLDLVFNYGVLSKEVLDGWVKAVY